jgi:predicted dehydrogenase
MPTRPVTAVVVGAGNRGSRYAAYALDHPYRLQIVAVADPSEIHRRTLSEAHGIPESRQYHSVEELTAQPAIADAAINGTMDTMHVPTSLPLLEAGYDLLLEKPLSTSESEMWQLVDAARHLDRKIMVCHVLRYAPFYRAIRERLETGEIGEIINIQTNEHVSYHHMAVAFVRGKWRNRAEGGSSMLMAKCCHDLDLIMWMKGGVRPSAVSSFGGQMQFRSEMAPEGAGTRCLVDCPIEADCLYSARKHYLDRPDRWKFYVWRDLEHLDDPTPEQRLELLKNDDRYGRCVWRSDNDVVDHQSVAIEFADGSTATHNLVGGTSRPIRSIHIVGTRGEIQGVFEDSKFVVRQINPTPDQEYSEELVDLRVTGDMSGSQGGHGGGDLRLVEDFVSFIRGEPRSISCTTIEDSINGHLVGFRADQSMEERRIMDIPESR